MKQIEEIPPEVMLFGTKSLLYGSLLAGCYAIKIASVSRLISSTWDTKVNPRDTFMLFMNIIGGLLMVTTVCLKETTPGLVGCKGLLVVTYLFQALFYLPLIVISVKFLFMSRLFTRSNIHADLDLSQTSVSYTNLNGKKRFLLKNSFYRFVYIVLVISELAVFVLLNDNSNMITRQNMGPQTLPVSNATAASFQSDDQALLGFCFNLYAYIPLIVIAVVYAFLMVSLLCLLRGEFIKYDNRKSVVYVLGVWLVTGLAFFCYDLAPLPEKIYTIAPGSLIIVFQIILSDWILYIKGYAKKRDTQPLHEDQFEMMVMTTISISSLLNIPTCRDQVFAVLNNKSTDEERAVASFITYCADEKANQTPHQSTLLSTYASVIQMLEDKYPGTRTGTQKDSGVKSDEEELDETPESREKFAALAATYLDTHCNHLLGEPELQALVKSLSQTNAEHIVARRA